MERSYSLQHIALTKIKKIIGTFNSSGKKTYTQWSATIIVLVLRTVPEFLTSSLRYPDLSLWKVVLDYFPFGCGLLKKALAFVLMFFILFFIIFTRNTHLFKINEHIQKSINSHGHNFSYQEIYIKQIK